MSQDKNVEDTLVEYLKRDHQTVPATIDDLIDKCSTFDDLWTARRVTNGLNRLMLQNCPIKKDKDKDPDGKTVTTYQYIPEYITPQWRKKQAKHQNTLPPAASPVSTKLPVTEEKSVVNKDDIELVMALLLINGTTDLDDIVSLFKIKNKERTYTEAQELLFATAKKFPKRIKLDIKAIAA